MKSKLTTLKRKLKLFELSLTMLVLSFVSSGCATQLQTQPVQPDIVLPDNWETLWLNANDKLTSSIKTQRSRLDSLDSSPQPSKP